MDGPSVFCILYIQYCTYCTSERLPWSNMTLLHPTTTTTTSSQILLLPSSSIKPHPFLSLLPIYPAAISRFIWFLMISYIYTTHLSHLSHPTHLLENCPNSFPNPIRLSPATATAAAADLQKAQKSYSQYFFAIT